MIRDYLRRAKSLVYRRLHIREIEYCPELIPFWMGAGHKNIATRELDFYIMPFHLVVRGWLWLCYRYAAMRFIAPDFIKLAYKRGYHDGYNAAGRVS